MKPLNLAILSLIFISTAFSQESDFFIRISANNSDVADCSTFVGIKDIATDAYDPGVDVPKPPTPAGNYVYVKIEPMNDSPSFYPAFSEDWRDSEIDLTTGSLYWEMEAENSVSNSQMSFTFDITNNTGQPVPVFLVVDNTYYDLLQNPTYSTGQSILEFAIIAGSIASPDVDMTNPTEGATIEGGESIECQWDVDHTLPIHSTSLTFSDDGGNNWTNLCSADSLRNSYSWEVPEEACSEGILKVKVEDELNHADSSQVSITINYETDEISSVTIVSPTTGSRLCGGDMVDLVWRYGNGTDGFLNSMIYWSINGGDYDLLHVENSTDTSYTFRVPDSVFTKDFSFVINTSLVSSNTRTDTLTGLIICPTLFCNSDFENWDNYGPDCGPPDSWWVSGNYGSDCMISESELNCVEGLCSAGIQIFSPGIYYMMQELSGDLVQPGTAYELNGRIRENNAGITANLRLGFLDASGALITYTDGVAATGTDEFERCSVVAVIPENCEIMRLAVKINATTVGTMYTDYFQLSNPEEYVIIDVTQPTINTEFTYDGLSQLPIEWNYGTTAPFVSTSRVEVSLDGGQLWTLITDISNNSTTDYNWIGVDDYSIQAKIKITANQGTDDEDSGESETFKIRPSTRIDTLQSGWHLFGLQMLPSDTSVQAIIGDDVSSAYYLYDYSSIAGYFSSEYLSSLDGYWLAVDEEEIIDVSGIASFASLSDKIYSGWNLISCGYPKDIERNDLKFSNGTITKSFQTAVNDGWIAGEIYGYTNATGQYYSVGSNGFLHAGEGYWMGVLVDSLDLIIDPPVFVQEQPDDNPYDPNPTRIAWESDIVAIIDGSLVEGLITIGVNPSASDDFDSNYDFPSPPESPGNDLPKLYFTNLSCPGVLGYRFSKEIKGEMNEENPLKTWRLIIEKGEEVELQLDFDHLLERMPVSYNAYLEFSNTTYNLRYSPLIAIVDAGPVSAELTVEYGADPVNEPVEISLPTKFSIHHLFPNPFNSQVHIRVEIPQTGTFELKVFNIKGQLVDVIYSGNLSAGYYDFNWRGTGTSGVYFVALNNSNGGRSIRKVVFLK